MKHDLKARFIAYAARQEHRPLDKDVPEEMDDMVFRYVNKRLGCCHIEERRLTPEESEAIEAAIAEDAASAEVVRSQIEGTLVINEILLPGMLLQWAEGMLEPAPTLAKRQAPLAPDAVDAPGAALPRARSGGRNPERRATRHGRRTP